MNEFQCRGVCGVCWITMDACVMNTNHLIFLVHVCICHLTRTKYRLLSSLILFYFILFSLLFSSPILSFLSYLISSYLVVCRTQCFRKEQLPTGALLLKAASQQQTTLEVMDRMESNQPLRDHGSRREMNYANMDFNGKISHY